jgi:hypothetical protein
LGVLALLEQLVGVLHVVGMSGDTESQQQRADEWRDINQASFVAAILHILFLMARIRREDCFDSGGFYQINGPCSRLWQGIKGDFRVEFGAKSLNSTGTEKTA